MTLASHNAKVGILLLCSLALVALCIMRLVVYPSLGDAQVFRQYAFAFRERGFLSDFGSIRTYGYPTFLYLLTFLSGEGSGRLAAVAGIAQFAFLVASVLWLAAHVSAQNGPLAWSVLIGVLLNPLVLGLVSDSLSDALPLALTPLLVCLSLVACRSPYHLALACSLLGAALAALCFMVRPSSVVILIAWHLSAVIGLCIRSWTTSTRLRTLGIYIIGACVLTGSAFVPQALYNLREWGQATVLPFCQLGHLQTVFGIAGLRYDTMVIDGVLSPFTYPNQFLGSDPTPPTGLGWYLQNPSAGAVTILGHLFLSLSVNTIFTYVYDGHSRYAILLLFFAWTIIGIGFVSAGRNAIILFRQRQHLTAQPVLFVALISAGTIALNAISAVELRYNVIVLSVLSVLACYLMQQVRGRRRLTVIIIAAVVAAPLAWLSDSLTRDGHLGFPPTNFDLGLAHCMLWKVPPTIAN